MRLAPPCLLAACLVVCAAAASQSPGPSTQADFLFGQALHLEQVEHDLAAAVAAYQKLLALPRIGRPVAARATLRLAICLEQLGRPEAAKAFETVVRDYADQPDAAAQARAGLARLRQRAAPLAARLTPRLVWDEPGDVSGQPSPDARYLCFTDWASNNLAIFDVTTGKVRVVTTDGKGQPNPQHPDGSAWSPDGKHIAYVWRAERSRELRLLDIQAGTTRAVSVFQPGRTWRLMGWTGDGRDIVCHGATRERNELAIFSLADGKTRLVPLPLLHVVNARVSPDGRYVAFDHIQRDDGDISVVPVKGGPLAPVVRHAAFDQLVGWAPDGEHLLYVSTRDATFGLWAVPMRGGTPAGQPRLLQRDLGRAVPLGLTASGTFFYWVDTSTRDIYVATVDLTAGTVFEAPTAVGGHLLGGNAAPAWSPDGSQLAYLSSVSANAVQTPTAFDLVSFWFPADRRQRTITASIRLRPWPVPRWFKDGQALLVTGVGEAGRSVPCRLDVQTGDVQVLVESGGVCAVVPLRDESRVVTCESSPPNQPSRALVVRDSRTGTETRLAPELPGGSLFPAMEAVESPDERWLATVAENRSAWVMPLDGTPGREVFVEPKPGRLLSVAWSPDSQSLVCGSLHRAGTGLAGRVTVVPLDGRPPMTLPLELAGVNDISVHPDGRHLAISVNSGVHLSVKAIDGILEALRR